MKRLDARINGSIEDNLEVDAKAYQRSSSNVSAQQLDTSMVANSSFYNLCVKHKKKLKETMTGTRCM